MSLRKALTKAAAIAGIMTGMALAGTIAANASPLALAGSPAALAAQTGETATLNPARAEKVHYRYRRYHRPRVILEFHVGPPPPVYYTPRRYYRSNSCTYWSARCSARWYRRQDYLGCMRYHRCW